MADPNQEPAVETPPSDPLKGLPTIERMFREELAKLGVKLDAFMFTPPVDWMEKQYFYRLTWPDGKTLTANIPWGISTFHVIIEEAKNP